MDNLNKLFCLFSKEFSGFVICLLVAGNEVDTDIIGDGKVLEKIDFEELSDARQFR